MVQMWDKYHSQGFEIFAFPCNQFANQEPGTDASIHAWAKETYGVQFPMFHKADVNGPAAQDTFKYCRFNSTLLDESNCIVGDITWNFGKFMMDPAGHVSKYYDPQVDLNSIEVDIQHALQ